MNLKVSKDGDKYRIVDDAGHQYGTYDSRDKAESNLVLWQEYLEAPMIF